MPKMKKEKLNPISIDIDFEETLNKNECIFVVNELVKNLIFQRRQIPLTIETLKQEIKSPKFQEDENPGENS